MGADHEHRVCTYADAGDDTIRGGKGDDWIRGSAGLDTIDGGAGIDTIQAKDSEVDTIKQDLADLLDADGFDVLV